MVALPISVISSTFQDKYQEHIENLKIEEAKLMCVCMHGLRKGGRGKNGWEADRQRKEGGRDGWRERERGREKRGGELEMGGKQVVLLPGTE